MSLFLLKSYSKANRYINTKRIILASSNRIHLGLPTSLGNGSITFRLSVIPLKQDRNGDFQIVEI